MSLKKDTSISLLSVDADTHRRIEAYARAVGTTPSEIVRKAFDRYEATSNGLRPDEGAGESVFDVLSRAGLIGCLRSAADTPTDLASNPEHMEGFGRE